MGNRTTQGIITMERSKQESCGFVYRCEGVAENEVDVTVYLTREGKPESVETYPEVPDRIKRNIEREAYRRWDQGEFDYRLPNF